MKFPGDVRSYLLRLSLVVVSLAAALTAATELRTIGPAQPISIDRVGVVGTNPVPASWSVMGNGDRFLLLWRDDRDVWPGPLTFGTLMLRIDANGAALDDVPAFLPFGVDWAGRRDAEWLLIGTGGFARINAEGELVEMRDAPGLLGGNVQGAAWTGNALVVATAEAVFSPSTGRSGFCRAVVFDRDLNYVTTYELSGASTFVLGVAGDESGSAMILYQPAPDAPSIRAATFNADGSLRKQNIFHSINAFPPEGHAVAAGEGRYAVVLGSTTSREVMTLDADLRKTYLGSLTGPFYPGIGTVWDGSSITVYSVVTPASKRVVTASRFAADGPATPATQTLMPWRTGTFLSVAQAGSAAMLLEGSQIEDIAFRMRTFHDPAELKSSSLLPRFVVERGAPAQGAAAAASGPSQSVVTWLERGASQTDPLVVYATRLDPNGKILDPQSLQLGTSPCSANRPLVATNGHDFLAAWAAGSQINVAAIHADGAIEKRVLGVVSPATCGNMQLASNGEDYLLVWPVRIESSFSHWELYGARLRADGTTIDTAPIRVALSVPITNAQNLHVAVASDGRDYLVAWENYASRVTREGVVLDRNRIELGPNPVVRTWWNGSAYVVQVRDGFLRIGANGTGGGPLGLVAAPVLNETAGLSAICDPTGCTAATVTFENGSYRATIVRLDAGGTGFTLRKTPVVNFVYPTGAGAPVRPVLAMAGGHSVLIHSIARVDPPYVGVMRLMVTPLGTPRSRAVEH
jgi:hypothetical protein